MGGNTTAGPYGVLCQRDRSQVPPGRRNLLVLADAKFGTVRGRPARKLTSYCPFYTVVGYDPSGSFLRVVRKEAVLPIFWTLTIVTPMSDEGGNGFSRIPILSFPPNLTRGNKELPDMKRAMFLVLTLTALAGLIGCAHHRPLPASCRRRL
jgi:hypothetical protein